MLTFSCTHCRKGFHEICKWISIPVLKISYPITLEQDVYINGARSRTSISVTLSVYIISVSTFYIQPDITICKSRSENKWYRHAISDQVHSALSLPTRTYTQIQGVWFDHCCACSAPKQGNIWHRWSIQKTVKRTKWMQKDKHIAIKNIWLAFATLKNNFNGTGLYSHACEHSKAGFQI